MKILLVLQQFCIISFLFIANTVAHNSGEVFDIALERVGGSWQVFLSEHDGDKKVLLSITRNNSNLVVSDDKATWEGFINNAWQVYIFDGIRVYQISEEGVTINPYMEGNFVVFGKRDGNSDWRTELYNITTGNSEKVSEGVGSKKSKLRNGEVVLTGKGYDEPTGVIAEDVLPSQMTDKVAYVTESDIKQELGLID